MKKLPEKEKVDRLKVQAQRLLKDLKTSPRGPAQPRLSVVLAYALQVFGTQRIEGLVAITNLSTGTLRKIQSGRTPQLATSYTFLGNLIEACNSYGSEASGETLTSLSTIGWIAVSPAAKQKVPQLLQLLSDLLAITEGSNAGNGAQAALNAHERAQLVVMLETALLHLKGPLIHKPFLAFLSERLSGVSKRVAERQVEIALGSGATALLSALILFIKVHLR
jgi:hypothetical protein